MKSLIHQVITWLVLVVPYSPTDCTRRNDLDPVYLSKLWSPEVRLAQGEIYRPSSVDYFLKFVNLHGASVTPLDAQSIPECNSDCFLETKVPLDCNSCTNPPVFRGQDPSTVPVYAVYEIKNTELKIDYWFFYPYNRGKKVCIGLYDSKGFWFIKPLGCIGGYSTFAHHVGDWESVQITLQIKDNQYVPLKLVLGIHNFDETFLWNGNQFVDENNAVSLVNNTHPIVYSASGSHGLWPNTGEHRYKNLPNGHFLADECSNGEIWRAWDNLKVVKKGNYSGEFNFFRYKGRWGNKESGCFLIESISGECMLNHGPTTPFIG